MGVPSKLSNVGSHDMLKPSGSTRVSIMVLNSESSFSSRCPKTSWKNTPLASPEKSTGPVYASARGALLRASARSIRSVMAFFNSSSLGSSPSLWAKNTLFSADISSFLSFTLTFRLMINDLRF